MEMHEAMNELHTLYGAWVRDQGNSDDNMDIIRLSRGMRKGLLRSFEAKRLTAA
jgi:glutathionylspermidine synthase